MRTILTKFFKKLWSGVIIWIWIILSIWIFFIAYASFTSMTQVWNGSPLTSSAWNLMVTNLDDLNIRLNTLNTTVSGLSATPTWAVMAFNLASCPTWWTVLASAAWKTIVWLNPAETEFNTLLKIWWAKTHTLTTTEIPNHNHRVPTTTRNWVSGSYAWWLQNFNYTSQVYTGLPTETIGGWWAHNNLQPYLTLLYCQKN